MWVDVRTGQESVTENRSSNVNGLATDVRFPSWGLDFEGKRLLLGVAYVQPHEINRASFTPVLWRGEEAFTMLL